MTSYIFLDIDGVLIDYAAIRASMAGSGIVYNPECINALNWLTDRSGAQIVVSSHWRARGLARIKVILAEWGATGEVLDITPNLDKRTETGVFVSSTRGEEIAAWLAVNPPAPFVIIDDEADMGHLLPFLVCTSYETGLTMQHARDALNILQNGISENIVRLA